MSLHPRQIEPIPAQTAAVCQAAFGKGNLVMQLRDELGGLYQDEQFQSLFSSQGQPGWSPWRLAFISVLQYLEDMTDRQAAQAVCARLDWKYALSLELTATGMDASVLSEFRERLVKGSATEVLLERLLAVCQQRGWLQGGGQQRSDSTHVEAALRRLHRLEVIGETLRAALNALAVVVPDWLSGVVSEDWYERYSVRVEEYRFPKAAAEQTGLALLMGRDGHHLLSQIEQDRACGWLRQVPAVEALRQVWVQQFYLDGTEQLHLRERADSPPSGQLIHSPYEVEARFARKRQTEWVGYKVHLSETCSAELPHLIVQVCTTPATTADGQMTSVIHQALAQKGLSPTQHLVDAAYVDTELLMAAHQAGVTLIGPVLADTSWQALTPEGLDATQFHLDWVQQQATCPAQQLSQSWKQSNDPQGKAMVRIQFDATHCRLCALQQRCTRSRSGRVLTLKAQPDYEVLLQARAFQQTPVFRQRYALRAGIEGTLSQALRAFGLRRCRYRGINKAHLQHVITAVAMNLARIANWLNNKPFAQTRLSQFAKLSTLSSSPTC